MIKFIKSTDVTIQRYKLFFFYILNIWDILFTQFVIIKMPDVFVEINPFMAPIIETEYALFLKVVIPALLLIFWNYKYTKASDKQKKTANVFINIIIVCFILINLLHLSNLIIFATLS